MTKWSFITLALLTGVGSAVVACSSDGDDAAAGGSGGSGGKGTAGTSSVAGKGGTSSTGGTSAASAGAAGASTDTLYDRLGGNSGIAAAVDAIVAAEVGDTDIASYFSQQADPNYSPSVADIKACLVLQLGSVSGGPEKYPAKTASGYTCRGMVEAHADLGINSGTFDKFVTIAAGVLTDAGVSAADIGKIGTVLVSTKSSIVTDKATTAEKPCTAPAACAAAGASAGGAGGAG